MIRTFSTALISLLTPMVSQKEAEVSSLTWEVLVYFELQHGHRSQGSTSCRPLPLIHTWIQHKPKEAFSSRPQLHKNLNHILKNPKVNQETIMALNSEDNINKSPDIDNKVPLHHWPQRLMSQGLENNYPVKLVMMEHSWKGTGLWWPRCFQVNEMCLTQTS